MRSGTQNRCNLIGELAGTTPDAYKRDNDVCTALIAGRFASGGKTHQVPSPCRKKKIATAPDDRFASIRT
jgi:hypothetical protein